MKIISIPDSIKGADLKMVDNCIDILSDGSGFVITMQSIDKGNEHGNVDIYIGNKFEKEVKIKGLKFLLNAIATTIEHIEEKH